MTLEIISAEQILFQGEVNAVTLPGEMGSFTVLQNHASLISVLVPGKLRYLDAEDSEHTVDVKGGLADVDNNVVSVCIY
ncbi:MAG: ATP synthase F1 subunit epsilon [Muribaculaceae bacterium]|nr:ATP synthase F1 subunit epsilon [Muribaculaceae bacterium]